MVVANDRFPNSHSGDRALGCDSAMSAPSVSVSRSRCAAVATFAARHGRLRAQTCVGDGAVPSVSGVGFHLVGRWTSSHAGERIVFVELWVIDSGYGIWILGMAVLIMHGNGKWVDAVAEWLGSW